MATLTHKGKRVGRPPGSISHRAKIVLPTTHPVVQQLTALQVGRRMTDVEMSRLAGYHEEMPSYWRHNKRRPNLQALTDYADVFGYEVRLVPKEKKNGAE